MFLKCFPKITYVLKKTKQKTQPPHTEGLMQSSSSPERKRKDAREDQREQNKADPGQDRKREREGRVPVSRNLAQAINFQH